MKAMKVSWPQHHSNTTGYRLQHCYRLQATLVFFAAEWSSSSPASGR
jgi:hypothetical protein